MAALADWFYANVLGNLVASVLWATPALLWHHRRMVHRLHRQDAQIAAEHEQTRALIRWEAGTPSPDGPSEQET